MRIFSFFFTLFMLLIQSLPLTAQKPMQGVQTLPNPWQNRRVAFLGDSITDEVHVGTTKNYWQFLEELLGLEPLVLGKNGHQWDGIYQQAKQLKALSDTPVDAILIFAGTNDFNAGIPQGEWFIETAEAVEVSGPQTEIRRKRTPQTDMNTFRGRINTTLAYLKANFPKQQIILLTPIHRGYARFGDRNIQPDEAYANRIGLFPDDYVTSIKEAGNIWAIPVIDLNSISGLYPSEAAQSVYVADEATDRLHPNADGHRRMARALMYQLLAYPASF